MAHPPEGDFTANQDRCPIKFLLKDVPLDTSGTFMINTPEIAGFDIFDITDEKKDGHFEVRIEPVFYEIYLMSELL